MIQNQHEEVDVKVADIFIINMCLLCKIIKGVSFSTLCLMLMWVYIKVQDQRYFNIKQSSWLSKTKLTQGGYNKVKPFDMRKLGDGTVMSHLNTHAQVKDLWWQPKVIH